METLKAESEDDSNDPPVFAPLGTEYINRNVVRRVGVIDVGSNSVRLVVFDGVARSPAYFYNEKILCGLGKGLLDTGKLNPDGVERALAAIRRFTALAKLMHLTRLESVATAAVREASDGKEFCDRVEKETGLTLSIASGAEEGALSAKGVLLGWPRADGVVCDIGGASMELAHLERGEIGHCETSPLGPLKLSGLDETDLKKAIDDGIKGLRKAIPGQHGRIFLVGGSWRAVARLDMERRGYPLKVLHEYRMSREDALETCRWIGTMTVDEMNDLTETSQARLELVPLAARVLPALLKALKVKTVTVSSYGLREGMLYEMMPDNLRERDPLIEASRHMERARARFPGFGDTLFAWLSPLYKGRSAGEQRLIHAACLLHDITWRAHPDYRAEVCFETVTRANLSGLDHEGRIFLGLSILHRYKSSARSHFDPAIIELLSEERQLEAEILGKALRLGAMLTGAAPGALEDTDISLRKGVLRLRLRSNARALAGEVVVKRLETLASRLGVEASLEVGTD
ncbi:Ppx/GppA family phosphatase [Algicella marina]|uniref:Exopolyphosphatase n=1 Tax=Algicella marina TaxID=2683284 RepID=A0A6P1T273_9RHOB|nr:Ppx/GppA family phosphatase [Algicella marina]QHQ35566.1 exopolyphosphatase [Algicella marina]